MFFTVLAALIVNKDGRIRRELENQTQSLLRVSRDALDQAQLIVARVKQTTQRLKNDNENNKYKTLQSSPNGSNGAANAGHISASTVINESQTPSEDEYSTLWQAVEARNKHHLR